LKKAKAKIPPFNGLQLNLMLDLSIFYRFPTILLLPKGPKPKNQIKSFLVSPTLPLQLS